MSIHISGSTGFVGTNLIAYLDKTMHQITPIDLRNNRMISFPEGTKAVIHLAGKAHDLKKVSDPKAYYAVNTELSKKMFDAFLLSNAEVFITLSSVKAVRDTIEGVLSETDIPHPQTDYGKSKLLADEYVLRKDIPTGKRVYVLRPCMIHGSGNKGNLNLLYKIASKRLPWPLAAFDNKRSFLSVENLCFVIKELIDRNDIPSGVYQVADDEAVSTNEIIQLIARTLNFKPQLWPIPQKLIKGLSKLGDFLHLPLNTERLKKLTENYVVSNHKLKKALKKNLPHSAQEGLIQTIRSFKGLESN